MNLYQDGAEEAFEDEPQVSMTLEEVDSYLEACNELVDKAKAAQKLSEDPNFKSIIMEDYFTKEPQRLGSLMASGKLTRQGFDGAVEDLRSIGHLRTFLQEFIQKGQIALEEKVQLEEARRQAILDQASI